MNDRRLQLKGFAEKLATEVPFVKTGGSNNWLSVNSLLGETEELLDVISPSEPPAEAVCTARQSVDGILARTGVFTASDLKRLDEWTGWMHNAVRALPRNSSLSTASVGWEQSTPTEPSISVICRPAVPTSVAEEEPIVPTSAASDGELLRDVSTRIVIQKVVGTNVGGVAIPGDVRGSLILAAPCRLNSNQSS